MAQASTVKRLLFFLCAMGTMAACAPGDCDPRQKRSVLTAGGCLATGGTDAFLDQMREEYAQLVEAKRLSDIEQRSLDLQARSAARDADIYRQQIKRAEADIDELRGDIETAVIESEEERTRQEFVLAEVDNLQGLLDQEKARNDASEAEILELRENIAKREVVLREMSRPIVVD